MFFLKKGGITKVMVFIRNMKIYERPGVPDSSKWKKKRLAEFSVFSVMQKTRRETILTILGSTSRFTFGSSFMKKRVLFQVHFFFDFVMFFERGRRRRGPPPNSRILKKLVAIQSRLAPLKGCGE